MNQPKTPFETQAYKYYGELYPSYLKCRNQWVVWRPIDGKKKPINPASGIITSAHDPDNQYSYQEAKEIAETNQNWGIGFSLQGLPLVLIDFDNVRNPNSGQIHPEVEDLVMRAESYSDISVSGTGIHTLIEADYPGSFGKGNISTPDFPDAKIEIGNGWFAAMSGHHIPSTPADIQSRQAFLNTLYEEYGNLSVEQTVSSDNHKPSDCRTESSQFGKIEAPDPDTVANAEAILEDFRKDYKTTKTAKSYLSHLEEGHYKRLGFIAKDGNADRSRAEFTLSGLLYGIFSEYGYGFDDPEKLTKAYMKSIAAEYPRTEDGQPRKISLGNDYLEDTIRQASSEFDSVTFEKWQRKKNIWDYWSNDYGDIIYDTVREVVWQKADADSRDYPTRREIVASCIAENPSRKSESYRKALGRLVDEGGLQMANISGNDYRYFPKKFPAPENAEWIRPEADEKEGENPWLSYL